MAKFEPKVLVRVYSFHAEERLANTENGEALGQILSKLEPSLDDILAPWRVFYEPWKPDDPEKAPITRTLSIEASKLQEQWHKFRRTNAKSEQIDTKGITPSIHDAIAVITDMSKAWEAKKWIGKRGKAKSYFHRLCKTLDSHSSMLDIMPRSNDYLSIFAGTVTTIIKASVNHEAIAEDVSEALCEITEVVAGCDVHLKLFATEDMQRTVADLYAHIFLFLNDTLCWYAKSTMKRTLDSFNERFRDAFHKSVENIKEKAGIIQQKAAQGSAAEIRATRLKLEAMQQDLRIGLQGLSRVQADSEFWIQRTQEQMAIEKADREYQSARLEHLGRSLDVLLTQVVDMRMIQWKSPPAIEAGAFAEEIVDSTPLHRSSSSISRDDLLIRSAGLEDYFHRDRICLVPIESSLAMLDPQLVASVSAWTKSSGNQILAIAGPAFEGYELENPMTGFAGKFVELAATSKVSVISYFCELRRREELIGENTKEEQGLLQMLYALIRQMLAMSFPEIHTNKEFPLDRFVQLDGSIRSWGEAITLFEDVQTLLPGTVLCVIDGMQWLDSRSTNMYTAQFVDVLRGGKLKTLFTTSGQARCLSQSLNRLELVCMDEETQSGAGAWTFEEAHFVL